MNVLVFRVGQLGDTLAALPAFWAVREHFKNARLTLLNDVQHGKSYVVARDILEGVGIFDDYLSYVFHASRTRRWISRVSLMMELRARRFDTLVYLYPPERTPAETARDRRFFRLAGIRNFIGMDFPYALPKFVRGEAPPVVPHEADLTIARLASSAIPVPPAGCGRMDLQLGATDQATVDAWLKSKPSDGGRPWIGVGPGSKMPAKVWPEERFRDAVTQLIERYDFQPVVFGGREDAPVGARLLSAWKRGYNAAGELGLRASAAALGRCKLYFGNDTGTMHLAAAAKTPCVAVFAARDYPGRWIPYGVPNRTLRKSVDCAGCMLIECNERRMECLLKIDVDEAVAACVDLLKECGFRA